MMPVGVERRTARVIVNPVSGRGAALRSLPGIRQRLAATFLDFSVAVSRHPGEARQLASEAIRSGHRILIAVGGDGTVHEIVNGIFSQTHAAPSEITLALIPRGTGNDWGRTLRVPHDVDAAVGLIEQGSTILMDVGVAELSSGARRVVRHFVNGSGLGFEAQVLKELPPRWLGALTYPVGVLRALLSYRALALHMVLGDRSVSGDVFELAVAVGRYLGGGMQIAPNAVPDDGLLDVVLIRDTARWRVLGELRRLVDGTLQESPIVEAFRSASLRVVSDQGANVQADGEFIGTTPVSYRVLYRALRVFAPSPAIPGRPTGSHCGSPVAGHTAADPAARRS